VNRYSGFPLFELVYEAEVRADIFSPGCEVSKSLISGAVVFCHPVSSTNGDRSRQTLLAMNKDLGAGILRQSVRDEIEGEPNKAEQFLVKRIVHSHIEIADSGVVRTGESV
jgi:hypothetical protein